MGAYTAPVISSTGLTINSYETYLNALIQTYLNTFGSTLYIQPDSAIYQWLSAIALYLYDLQSLGVLIYNGRSPTTAVGSDLDAIVALNGLVRQAATFSTALVTIIGTPFTIINNGVVQDTNNNLWSLPSTYTIPSGGSGSVSVTCQTAGAIQAGIGAITIIATPTAGWVSVTNAAAAAPGTPIEADSVLRSRQAISTALPSSTRLAGTAADVAAVPGVTRSLVLENPTGSVDGYGNPAHSITVVVEGGNTTAIAQAIYDNKGIGPLVNGTNPGTGAIAVVITDASNAGLSQTIYFYRPVDVPIYVSLTVTPLAGYTSATTTAIQEAIYNYLNELEIGESVIYSEMYGAALTARPNPVMPLFSITALTIGTSASPTGTTSISLSFYQVSQGILGNITVTT